MTTSIDSSVLLSFYQARNAGSAAATAVGKAAVKAPTPPWDVTTTSKPTPASELVKRALLGGKFVDETTAQLNVQGASTDYRKLFAAYGGLNSLAALAERAGGANVSSIELGQIQRAFAKGLTEVGGYLGDVDLDNLRLVQGQSATKAQSEAYTTGRSEYVTKPLASGARTDEVAAFTGPVEFDVSVKPLNGPAIAVHMDLDEMGSTPRSISEVVLYLNDKLEDAGVSTRFANQRIAGVPVTKVIGGKTVTLSTPPDQYALKLKPGIGEALSFSAPATAPAVYVAQTAGVSDAKAKSDTTVRQLLKFQADGVGGAVADPVARPGDAFRTDERVFSTDLGGEVAAVKASQVGPDGSLYTLSEVNGATDGQAIKGARDLTLSKFDSAGNLVWTRTLGAGGEATGYGLAISPDGRVAVSGSIKGSLTAGEINVDATKTDSFVTMYDAKGDETWTYRKGARDDDEARSVAFAADGTLYVAGRSKSAMPGGTAAGGWDGYLQSFTTSTTGKPVLGVSQTFGGAGNEGVSGLAVNGNQVVVAGVDDGHGMLRSFDVTGGVATAGATRDLGALNGGSLAGVAFDGSGQLVVAGSAGATLSAGTETHGYTGGKDAFVARLSANLTADAADRIAYWGGTSDEAVTSLSVTGGRVFIGGSSTSDLPAGSASGSARGFVLSLDPAAGAPDWSQTWSGKDARVAPTSIAVDAGGASVLDRLGLPTGAIDFGASTKVVSQTSARAGDVFYVEAEGGARKAVTVEADDTFATLAKKVGRALGFAGSATVKRDVIGANADKTDILGNTSRLVITSRNQNTRIVLSAGPSGRDALEALGLSEGEVRTLPTGTTQADLEKAGEVRTYGLALSTDLTLSSKAEMKRASDALQAALTTIRTAYRDLKTKLDPAAKSTATGPAPAYLTAQIANYQAALSRLGG